MNGDAGQLYVMADDPALGRLLEGVVVEDGELRLAPVPGSPRPLGPALDAAAAFSGPAGIAVDGEGGVYLADPVGHRVLRVDACSSESEPAGCVCGPGTAPGLVDGPRGVAVGPRRRLHVADTGNDRIQSFDLDTMQLVGLVGGLAGPQDLAVDAAGALYVCEHGAGRVSKLDLELRPMAGFATRLQAQAVVPDRPVAVAVAVVDGAERLIVANRGAEAPILVYRLDGTYDAESASAWSDALVAVLGGAPTPTGVAAGPAALYVTDESTGGLLAFAPDGSFLGRAAGYQGRAAGLALDGLGRLLVHRGSGGSALLLEPTGVVASGTFVLGPVAVPGSPADATAWQRLTALATGHDGGHLHLFTLTSDVSVTPPPLPAAPPAESPRTTPLDAWRAAPAGATDLLVLNAPGRFLWIGGRLVAGGGRSPAVAGFRVRHDRPGWLPLLPEIYARDADSRVFLQRVLALAESALDDEGDLLDGLPALLGVAGAPDAAGARWLDWLAGWLAFPLDERWDAGTRRDAVAAAFELNGRRGTAEGLRDLIRLALGIDVRIEEPGAGISLWQLGDPATGLGLTTHLAGAEAQGAVLGTTATLGSSHLLAEDELGAPLFDGLAARFCVHVLAADVPDGGALEELRRLVERERPAETESHVCVVGPSARVGVQARLGLDAIVAGGPGGLTLGGPGGLGVDSSLASARPGSGARLGHGARTGMTTRLI